MAFQSGTQIRPELANADLSGFQRAAEINAQMLSQLGQDIGGAIKAHAVKKQEAKDVKTLAEIEGITAAIPRCLCCVKASWWSILENQCKNLEEGNINRKDSLIVNRRIGYLHW
jgi:hypothetical protein